MLRLCFQITGGSRRGRTKDVEFQLGSTWNFFANTNALVLGRDECVIFFKSNGRVMMCFLFPQRNISLNGPAERRAGHSQK